MHTKITGFKTLLPGLYLSLVLASLIVSLPSLFTDNLSYCSGNVTIPCLPYGLIALILLHLPLAFILQPILNFVDTRTLHPSLVFLFLTFFLLDLATCIIIGSLLDLVFFRRKPPPDSPSATNLVNPLQIL